MATVVLENVHVDFPIYGGHRSLRRVVFERATGGLIKHSGDKSDRVMVKALSGLNFELHDGDRVGLVGHNGAGKSTLLKVIAGVYEPTAGRVLVEGRITPLFTAMPGMDGEDTGYENIMTAGQLLNIPPKKLESLLPQIEEFSELGEYLTLPMRTYSSGMVTRLGFALATSIDPGILLIDEGIGAGDARFAEKAAQRMTDFIGRSSIMVIASHSNALIQSTCNKALFMRAGQIVAAGPVDEILALYSATPYEASAGAAG